MDWMPACAGMTMVDAAYDDAIRALTADAGNASLMPAYPPSTAGVRLRAMPQAPMSSRASKAQMPNTPPPDELSGGGGAGDATQDGCDRDCQLSVVVNTYATPGPPKVGTWFGGGGLSPGA